MKRIGRLVRKESFEFMGCVIEIWKFGIDERIDERTERVRLSHFPSLSISLCCNREQQ
jgi:hypothetical protein